MPVFKENELRFLREHILCRLATCSRGQPHVTPVIYAMDDENIIIATDYGTKKLKNLLENPNVALVVDDFRPNKGIMVTGKCQVFERGREYLRLLSILYDKFESYRKNPWKEGEAPILKIMPKKSVSWGIAK